MGAKAPWGTAVAVAVEEVAGLLAIRLAPPRVTRGEPAGVCPTEVLEAVVAREEGAPVTVERQGKLEDGP